MERAIPDNWIDASIIILFLLIGIVMEITIALSSLSEEKRLYPEETKNAKAAPPPLSDPEITGPPAGEPAELFLDEEISPISPENPEEYPADAIRQRKGYNAEEILAYIETAYIDGKLKPDNEVTDIPETDCADIREYLQSFKLRGKIIVEPVNGVFHVRLDKESLKKFIALQCDARRVGS
jgi:hypothetical protein